MDSESDEKPDMMVVMGAVVAIVTACGIVTAVLLMIAGIVAL